MRELGELFENNCRWAAKKTECDPEFFKRLAKGQSPRFLWIGCSDSRMPANEILGLEPGEVFVHRNVANLCPHSDFNCLSVLQYAVDYLKVEHVIICGHYGCGGVQAAMQQAQFGLVDNWLRHIRDVFAQKEEELRELNDDQRCDRLVELNVLQQAMNVCTTTIVQNAWKNGRKLFVHGWVYDLKSGLLKDLGFCVGSLSEVEGYYHTLSPAE